MAKKNETIKLNETKGKLNGVKWKFRVMLNLKVETKGLTGNQKSVKVAENNEMNGKKNRMKEKFS